jgi:hypothetical protein
MSRRPLRFFDSEPISNDGNISPSLTRGPSSPPAPTQASCSLSSEYAAEAQIVGMEKEGIELAVLFPTVVCRSSLTTIWIRNFTQADFEKVDTASKRRDKLHAAQA